MATPALSRPRPPGTPDRPRAAAPAPARVAGRYRYDHRSGTWWWSPEMFALHGRPADSAQPDTEATLGYQCAEDRGRLLEAMTVACTAGRAFALETRIVRHDGQERDVVLVGEPVTDDVGAVLAVEGVAVDITEAHRPGSPVDRAKDLEAEVGQLRAAMASRAAIEQAKGILMLLTGCTDPVAFDLLAHISSHTHRKVRDVAVVLTASAAGQERLPDDIRSIIRDACPPSQPLR